MPLIHVTLRDGTSRAIAATNDRPLMEALRDADTGVAAICGGVMSCGTCHVFIAEDWLDRLPIQSPDEIELLNAFDTCRPNSRLSCQISVTDALDGLPLTIAPEE